MKTKGSSGIRFASSTSSTDVIQIPKSIFFVAQVALVEHKGFIDNFFQYRSPAPRLWAEYMRTSSLTLTNGKTNQATPIKNMRKRQLPATCNPIRCNYSSLCRTGVISCAKKVLGNRRIDKTIAFRCIADSPLFQGIHAGSKIYVIK